MTSCNKVETQWQKISKAEQKRNKQRSSKNFKKDGIYCLWQFFFPKITTWSKSRNILKSHSSRLKTNCAKIALFAQTLFFTTHAFFLSGKKNSSKNSFLARVSLTCQEFWACWLGGRRRRRRIYANDYNKKQNAQNWELDGREREIWNMQESLFFPICLSLSLWLSHSKVFEKVWKKNAYFTAKLILSQIFKLTIIFNYYFLLPSLLCRPVTRPCSAHARRVTWKSRGTCWAGALR